MRPTLRGGRVTSHGNGIRSVGHAGLEVSRIGLGTMTLRFDPDTPIVVTLEALHDQLDEAVAALEVALTPEDCAFLEAPYLPHRVLGFEPVSSR